MVSIYYINEDDGVVTGSCKGDSGGLVDYQKVSYDSLFVVF